MRTRNKWATALTCLLCCSCTTYRSNHEIHEGDRKNIDDQLGPEISLKADREALEEFRKQIPEEKKQSNDELALYLQLMKQGTENPQMVRDKFTVLVEKRRSSFRSKVQKLRDDYHHQETKRRDAFLDKQKSKRNSFTGSKHSSAETREFFGQQDKDRQEFFADERDRRGNFESEISAQSKDFDSYMREKMNEFNEQYRLYSKKYSERPKEKKAVTGEGDDSKPLGTQD